MKLRRSEMSMIPRARFATPLFITLLAGAMLACQTLGGFFVTPTPAKPTITTRPTSTPPTPTIPPAQQTRAARATLEPEGAAAVSNPTFTPVVESLSRKGPWGLFVAEDGVWAFNSDGSALTRLVERPQSSYSGMRLAAAPSGGLAALVYDRGKEARDLALYLLNLPEREFSQITPLLPDDLEPQEIEPGGDAYEALRAIDQPGSLAWSPDGKRLAFIGAQDGPTADLYTYDLETEKLLRLSDGPSQAYQPSWSPDGKLILHAGADAFGTGAGLAMAGIWAAEASSEKVMSLYTPLSSGEVFMGWANPTTFLVHSWAADCGNHNLRLYAIDRRRSTALWQNYFSNLARDPATGAMLISVDRIVSECNADQQKGVWLVSPQSGVVRKLFDSEYSQLKWSAERELFFVLANGALKAVTASGDVRPTALDLPLMPVSAPEQFIDAWAGGVMDAAQGVWVGRLDGKPRQIYDGNAWGASWSPDGRTLFFFSAEGLNRATGSHYEPQVLGEVSADDEGILWVRP